MSVWRLWREIHIASVRVPCGQGAKGVLFHEYASPGAPPVKPGILAALLLAVTLPAIVCASPATAQSLESGTVFDAVAALKPGQFLWAPQLAPAGPILIIINRTSQRMVVYRNGIPIGISTVSTGRKGHLTPTGVFTILQKQITHFSSIYNNAPMPFMERLTWDGVALHGGQLPGYPASHGCIRLPHEFAKLLYGETALGSVVVITDSPELPRIAPTISFGSKAPITDIAPRSDATEWFPERSPTGPLSIVISAADKRLVVMRNGVQIGSASVELAQPVERPAAYTLQSITAAGEQWVRLPLPGQNLATPLPSETGQRVVLPPGVEALVKAELVPGATVLMLPDAIARGNGRPGALLESEAAKPPPK